MSKMTYAEWTEKTNQHDLALEMGYESWEEVPAMTQLHILHRLAEMWITYKLG